MILVPRKYNIFLMTNILNISYPVNDKVDNTKTPMGNINFARSPNAFHFIYYISLFLKRGRNLPKVKEMVTDSHTHNSRSGQKNFVISTPLLLLSCYIVSGLIAYSYVFENWSLIESMYFCVVTFTT